MAARSRRPIPFSRIYLNAHWLSDVVGAAVAGVALLIAILLYPGARLCERAPARAC